MLPITLTVLTESLWTMRFTTQKQTKQISMKSPTQMVFLICSKFSGKCLGKNLDQPVSAYAGDNPRTVSLWMKASRHGNNYNSVVYALGNRPGNSGGSHTAWGLQGPRSWTWMRSFYNNVHNTNNFRHEQGYYNQWRHLAHCGR